MADFLWDPEITRGAEQRTAAPLSHRVSILFFFFSVEHGVEKVNFLKML